MLLGNSRCSEQLHKEWARFPPTSSTSCQASVELIATGRSLNPYVPLKSTDFCNGGKERRTNAKRSHVEQKEHVLPGQGAQRVQKSLPG